MTTSTPAGRSATRSPARASWRSSANPASARPTPHTGRLRNGIELIRYLWTQHGNQVTFVLVGAGLDPFLDANPALKSRVTRYARFYPWSPADAARYAPQYHPLFERATPAVLRAAYDRIGGVFREWARLLESCLTVVEETGEPQRLTKDLLDEALERRG